MIILLSTAVIGLHLTDINDDDFNSALIEFRIKWKTIFRISVSSPLDFMAVSKVFFMLSLSTYGEHVNF